MKKILFIICIVANGGFMNTNAQEKVYTQSYDSLHNQNIYEGLLTVNKDHQFHKNNFFFSTLAVKDFSNKKLYKPLLNVLTDVNKKENITLIVVGGIWWCPDTRDILSQLVQYIEKTDFNNITSIAIDRKKTSASYELVNEYHVARVPTLIIMKDNQEIGRVVEYGKNGHWEKELSNILHQAIK